MPYTPLEWKDGPQGGTPITAAALNRMEQGIVDAHTVIDAATPGVQANTLVRRDSNGRAQFADPIAAQDAATKGYVDAYISGRSAVIAIDVPSTKINPIDVGYPIYQTEQIDRLNEYDPATGEFIATQSGLYLATATLKIEIAPNSYTAVYFRSDGFTLADVVINNPLTSMQWAVVNLADIIQLNAGQSLYVMVTN